LPARAAAAFVSSKIAHPELLDRLPDKIRGAFQDKLVSGQSPRLFYNHLHGIHIRTYPRGQEGDRVSEEPAGVGHNSDTGFIVPTWRISIRPSSRAGPGSFARHYMRKTVSCTTAPGGMGKSSNALTEAMLMATGGELSGERASACLSIWYHNGEDSREEIERRVLAVCQHFGIQQQALVGRLYITSGNELPLKVATGYDKLSIDAPLIEQIGAKLADLAST
jgi:hypothetical protein